MPRGRKESDGTFILCVLFVFGIKRCTKMNNLSIFKQIYLHLFTAKNKLKKNILSHYATQCLLLLLLSEASEGIF